MYYIISLRILFMSDTLKRLIVFEGNEGTGKSTHIKLLSQYLSERNIKHYITREPGGSEYGEIIREMVLDKNSNLDALSDALLLYSSRFYNFNNILIKRILSGDFVITDRFHYSTLVYQGYVQNCKEVIKLHEVLDPYFRKYIAKIFYFRTTVDTSSNRISKRISSDKFEIQGKDFLSKIDNAYNKVFKNNNDVVEIVTDGEKNIAQNKIRECIDKIINAKGK